MTDRAESHEPEEAEAVESDAPVAESEASADAEADVDALDEEQADDVDDESAERVERRSDVVIVTLVFVVLFGYQLYAAVSNLVALPEIYAAAGIADAVPWAILVANVAAPAIAFAAASAVAQGRRLAARAGILLLGFGISAQLSLLCEELARQAAAAAFAH